MSRFTRKTKFLLWLIALAFSVPAISSTALGQYVEHNLVTNKKTSAPHADPTLVNAWGLSFLPTSPFWISDEASGKTTVYDASGALKLTVSIPSASGKGLGSPTGQVANPNSTIFMISQKTSTGTKTGSAAFIFATLDGTISGWNPNVDAGSAVIALDRSKDGDSYTGLAIDTFTPAGSTKPETFLAAADAAHNVVRVFDDTFKLVESLSDPHTPKGLAVYGIQTDGDNVYVTLGAFGSTAGAVDVFNLKAKTVRRLITNGPGGHLNLPWGIAVAPKNFAKFSNDLLVGNLGNGWINAFSPANGDFEGTLESGGEPIVINGLWALEFGGGDTANNGAMNQLFFTAGPDQYTAGVFGVIEVAP
jgi:uncharacterized protein (TIGR03118 family)